MLVLDEADRLLDMGFEARYDVRVVRGGSGGEDICECIWLKLWGI